ncbi:MULTISPECIES: 50S ribosomal protein L30 [Nitrosomonas]|uniref:Large ribosomal subunit protein uL30 n=1 Tax=Nitrosomonas communis TaxID=44574 RepID=A0A0F7KJD5_9PROT|nr:MULTISPECIES: 50S ribosomal protein L30 [Nitrosomonas]AKH39064.1 50S ribosomal protein L30 [Nitrosomonas communis]TYP80165.1 large subunit ribosomal protein L30 [Nitrosomonas communis]UVS61232.1 50S ribosomal protein L30 [Nitrosomonas sp. PLL12]
MIKDKNAILRVKLVKSLIGKKNEHRRIIAGLGLKRINSITILQDSPSIRGMINKVSYLVKVEQ